MSDSRTDKDHNAYCLLRLTIILNVEVKYKKRKVVMLYEEPKKNITRTPRGYL